MPAPATSSRHLYTGHHRGHIQAAPRLRTHRGEPLSWDHPQIPVSMPSLFRFDASAVVHTCSSSHRTPAPLTARRQPQALTTPALDRRSLRWFGISACTATPEDLPPSLAQHGSCRRSSTSSSLPFRTHVGAGNSAVVVDLPRCGPMLSPRVPNLVPIVGITRSARCAVRPLEGPRDHCVAPPNRCAAPPSRPTRPHRRRPELARGDRGRAPTTEPSRVAGHPRHAVAPGTGAASSGTGPNHSDRRADHRPQRSFADSHCASQPRIRPGATAASTANCSGSATPSQRQLSGRSSTTPESTRTHTLQSHPVAVPAVPSSRGL